MLRDFLNEHPRWAAAGYTVLLALLLTLYTQNVWEDYYITFRSSQNLAAGEGLVYHPGERLHTFTSPLGVLLPALTSVLTGNRSDEAALWLFRIMCLGALGGAAALLTGLLRRLGWAAGAVGFFVLWAFLDVKSLNFSLNGMETAWMLLFISYALWAHFTPGPRAWLHLGVAWAGLMWTRPDSFIYIALLGGGLWLFNQPARTGLDRRQLLRVTLQAALLTTLLYGPWLLWAWSYYGSPIPHTIVAKGLHGDGEHALSRLLGQGWQMPWLIWQGRTAVPSAFLPSYHIFPSWPAWMVPFGQILGTLACLAWLLPKVRLEIRVCSLAFAGALAYLSFVPYFPFPWYFPPAALLGYLTIAGLGAQLWTWLAPTGRRLLLGLAALALTASLVLTAGSARQLRAQQALVERGTRQVIGEWLREHAQPGATVFMEPLGYIGYYSRLKTYDWPGLSSREVTEARRLVGPGWGELMLYLQPDWLVLRARGDGDLPQISPGLAAAGYTMVHAVDRSAEVAARKLWGRGWLTFDSHFVVYQRQQPFRQDTDDFQLASPITTNVQEVLGRRMRMVHAPGILVAEAPAGARIVSLAYGMPEGVRGEPYPTDGAQFEVWLSTPRQRHLLHIKHLQPVTHPADRELQEVSLDLPPIDHPGPRHLVLVTHPAGHMAKDWTFWADPVFSP
jgi:hypothetical protein